MHEKQKLPATFSAHSTEHKYPADCGGSGACGCSLSRTKERRRRTPTPEPPSADKFILCETRNPCRLRDQFQPERPGGHIAEAAAWLCSLSRNRLTRHLDPRQRNLGAKVWWVATASRPILGESGYGGGTKPCQPDPRKVAKLGRNDSADPLGQNKNTSARTDVWMLFLIRSFGEA